MRAAIGREHGPPEVVRVGVRAAAVSYPDVLLVAGMSPVKLPVPFIPGSEYAGIVTEAGAHAGI